MSDVNFIIVRPALPNVDFVAAVATQFPAVAADILDEEWADHIYSQVACLTRYANTCIEGGDLLEFERILRFVDEMQLKDDSSLNDALLVSFLEMLDLDGDAAIRQAARKLLSPWQLELYLAISAFYHRPPSRTDPR